MFQYTFLTKQMFSFKIITLYINGNHMRLYIISCCTGVQRKRKKNLVFLLVIYNFCILLYKRGKNYALAHVYTHTNTLRLSHVTWLVVGTHLRGHGQERVVLELRTRKILSRNITICIYNATIRYNARIRFFLIKTSYT